MKLPINLAMWPNLVKQLIQLIKKLVISLFKILGYWCLIFYFWYGYLYLSTDFIIGKKEYNSFQWL